MERNPRRRARFGGHTGEELILEGPEHRQLREHILGGGGERIDAGGVIVGGWPRRRLRDRGAQTGNAGDKPIDHPWRDELGTGTAGETPNHVEHGPAEFDRVVAGGDGGLEWLGCGGPCLRDTGHVGRPTGSGQCLGQR